MSDPVSDAAQRALDLGCSLEDAAREALEPVRALHRPDGNYGYCTECAACGTGWPCSTADVIYTSDELQDIYRQIERR